MSSNITSPEPVAIVGMDCIYPGAADLRTFWNNILDSKLCVESVPSSRWNLADAEKRAEALKGGFLPASLEFDCARFGITPSEVDQGDPEQFLVLMAIDRALRDAKLSQTLQVSSPERTEIVLGRGAYISNGAEHIYLRTDAIDQVTEILRQVLPSSADQIRESLVDSLRPVNADVVTCAMSNLSAGRAANCLNVMGRNYTVDAACASSLIAVEHVTRSLRDGRCDVGIAGGVHIQQKAPFWSSFQALGAMSPSSVCRPFDKDADGLLPGEGIGVVVLKRLSDAQRDGDRIYAVIRAVGVSSDGRGTSVLAPRVEGQTLAMRRAYEEAGVSIDSVGLIEGHGTATIAGDTTEIESLHAIFGKEGRGIALGSVKSMIGHAMPAAGMAGLIKTALAVYHGILPPTLNVTIANPGLEGSRFEINTATRPWVPVPDHPRTAGVNAFGFGGVNAHAILEEHPDDENWQALSNRSTELFFTAANSAPELARHCEALAQQVEHSDEPLAQICKAELERATGPARVGIIAKDAAGLAKQLRVAAARIKTDPNPHWQDRAGIHFGSGRYSGKLAFLFPGLGFPGLAGGYPARLAELYQHFPMVRNGVDATCAMATDGAKGRPLSAQLFPPPMFSREQKEEIEAELAWSERSYDGLNMASLASFHLLESFGVKTDSMAGFSLGEVSSLLAAGVMDLSMANSDVRSRMAAMRSADDAGEGEASLWGMVATSSEHATALMRHIPGVSVTIDVSPTQVFIGGKEESVRRAVAEIGDHGIWGQVLPAFPMLAPYLAVHTGNASPLEKKIRELLWTLPIGKSSCPVYSGTTTEIVAGSDDEVRETILLSVTEPVRIRDTIKRLYDDGHRIFLQLGAGGKMLSNIANTLEGSEYAAMSIDVGHRGGLEQLQHVLAQLATLGVEVDLSRLYAWRELPKAPSRTRGRLVKRLSLTPPRLRLSEAVAAEVRSKLVAAEVPSVPIPAPVAAPSLVAPRPPSIIEQNAVVMKQFLDGELEAERSELQLADRFLNLQQAAAAAFGGRNGKKRILPPPLPPPLLGTIVKLAPGEELESELVLDLNTHSFLKQHALINVPEGFLPIEQRLPTLPMTFEIEIAAEAAEALMPGMLATACHDVEALKWVALEDRLTLPITVRAKRVGPTEVRVELFVDGQTAASFRAFATMGRSWPDRPAPMEQQYDQPAPHTAEEYYLKGPVFHGPIYKLMRALGPMSDTDISAELVASDSPEPFLFDPLLLDALQHVIGYRGWLHAAFIMPVGLKRITRYGPKPAPGSKVHARYKYRKLDARRSESDYEAYDDAGNLWVRVEGFKAWKMISPSALNEVNERPLDGQLSRPFENGALGCHASATDFGDIQPAWIARWYLRPAEMARFRETASVDWLLERAAAKDVARTLLRSRGIHLHPLQVELADRWDGSVKVVVPDLPEIDVWVSSSDGEATATIRG